MSPRRSALLAVVAAAIAVGGLPAAAHAAHPAALGTGDPATSIAPSAAFRNACAGIDNTSQSDEDACEHAAAYDFSSVWSGEGITQAFVVPADFDTMTVPDQLVAITDVEREARGLTAVTGRASALDAIAQDGATNDDDPLLPNPMRGNQEASNWAGAGNSVLLDDFYWMYDDGVGSPNSFCGTAGDPGCWGHRDNIIGSYDSPLMMGAAVAYGTGAGTSMTELFIGGDTEDAPGGAGGSGNPGTGATPAVRLSSRSVSLTTQMRAAASKRVTATATSGSLALSASITSGAASWKVSPTACTTTPSKPCTFTVTFSTTGAPGAHNGKLILHSAAGNQGVTLNGSQLQPDLQVGISGIVADSKLGHVQRGHHFTVTGTVLTAHDEHRIRHARVVLETRDGSHGTWHRNTVKYSNSRGKVIFRPKPTHHHSRYRVVVTSSTKAVEIVSWPFSVVVD